MNSQVERRRHPRYMVKSDVLAVLKPYPVKLGQIANISEEGAAFIYLGEKQFSEQYSHLDLYAERGNRTCNAIPIKLLGFAKIVLIYGVLPIQRVSVCFQDLTGEQKEQIKGFITHHAE